jgi:hypothetical protein
MDALKSSTLEGCLLIYSVALCLSWTDSAIFLRLQFRHGCALDPQRALRAVQGLAAHENAQRHYSLVTV